MVAPGLLWAAIDWHLPLGAFIILAAILAIARQIDVRLVLFTAALLLGTVAGQPDVIVLDSSFLIAFDNERDSKHAAGRGLMREFLDGRWGKGLLPEYVFLEVVTVLLVRRDLLTAVRTGQLLLEARELEFVPCSDVFLNTVQLFSSQKNTSLSFADAAIAVIARTRSDGQV